MTTRSATLPPRRARGGGSPHHARGGRRARAARAPLLGRQGLDRAAAPGREGVPPRPLPLPADARRHGAQLPRGDRVPRPARRRARRAARRRLGAGVDRQRPRRRADGPARLAQPAADDDAARRDGVEPVRRGDRRRPARRGALPREGADLLVPRRLRPVGSARPAPGALESLQRQDPQGRAGARLPDLELDRARRVAVRRPRGARAAVDLLRPRARGVRARRDALRDLGRDRARRRTRCRSPSGCASAPSAT